MLAFPQALSPVVRHAKELEWVEALTRKEYRDILDPPRIFSQERKTPGGS
jgi:hypothetical protein